MTHALVDRDTHRECHAFLNQLSSLILASICSSCFLELKVQGSCVLDLFG